MTQAGHTERAHALLGASKASQWISCPPSARLQEGIPEKRSKYADEGTLAHELGENKLRRRVLPCDSKERKRLDEILAKVHEDSNYSAEMENDIQEYAELVEERFMEARSRSEDAVILLEERLDFSEWVPDGYGTGDVVIIADGVLEVIDLKYGKGVPVSAAKNAQLRLYGLGAWSIYNYLYNIDEIRMTIVQPRLDSVSTDRMTVTELLEWAESVVKPAAAQANAGEGEFKCGDHCRWCKIKGNCRARADANLQAIAYEFRDPALLTPEEIGSILYIAQQLKSWAGDVEEHAFEQAKRGVKIPQWKLVEGRSNRTITDKEAAKTAFAVAEIPEEKYLKPQELLGIGELEKRVGKKELVGLIGDLILKPPAKPVLVPESDNRPELNSVANDFAGEDFSDI
ncbi:DUF2800 domain-containing protein [Gorillibacterium sp. sgz5001074]|uniref:DUF2800 domain-containing protein n=1 Tax=Gorillibacterium sp. sgz5001074 TaxID=3446695 RepID=UPI003F66E93B